MQKRVGILYIRCQTVNSDAHNHAQKKVARAGGCAPGFGCGNTSRGQSSSPTCEMGTGPREDRGRKGLGSAPCHVSHARPPACKAHPAPGAGRGRRSCSLFSARFLLIAASPLSSVLLSHVASLFVVLAVRFPRRSVNDAVLPRTSAQQLAQTCTAQSGVCAKQPEVSA